MSIPKYNEMYTPILQLLSDGKQHRRSELMPYTVNHFNLSENDRKLLQPSGRITYLSNRISWAALYLKKAGLIVSPLRGQYIITDEGLKAVNSGEVIDDNYLCRYESFRQFKNRNLSEIEDKENTDSHADLSDTPDDILEAAVRRLSDDLAEELLDEIMKLTPTAFEHLVLRCHEEDGLRYRLRSDVAVKGRGDRRVIMEDKLGFDRIYVQAKLWERSRTVARPDTQAFVGAIAGRGGKGLFVTTAKFSQGRGRLRPRSAHYID